MTEATAIDLQASINKVFQPLLYTQQRIVLMLGSAGSGKSVFCAQKLVIRCLMEGNHRFLAVRKVQRTLRESVWSEVLWLIDEWRLREVTEIQINKSEMWIGIGNSRIICTGLDDPEKIKSISGITGIWVEELSELSFDEFTQLNLRLRNSTSHYRQILGSFNPVSEDSWIKRMYYDKEHPDVIRHKSTYLQNPYLDESYRLTLEQYKETNPLYYQIYVLAEWGLRDKAGKFLWAWEPDKHVSEKPRYIPQLALRLSFDFNIEPFAVSVYQRLDGNTLHIFDKIRLNDSDIYAVCDTIKSMYPRAVYICTGDASGKNLTGTTRGKTSYWQIIRQQLNLSNAQLRIRSKNIDLINSRVRCNAALRTKNILVHPRCEELIHDATYASVDAEGVLVKDREANKNDFLDTFRYLLDAEWPTIIPNHKNYDTRSIETQ